MQGDPFENIFELIKNYFFTIELVHVAFCLNYESFESVLLDSSIFLIFPQPFDMRGGQQLQHQPRLFSIRLVIDDYFVSRDVEVEGVIFSEEVIFLQSSLELAT